MAFFENVLFLATELLVFHIPTFYTFKFLMNNNAVKIRTVLKFWCVLTIYHLLQWMLSQIIADHIFPIIDLAVLIALNVQEMQYAETVFDTIIGPAYSNNREFIENITQNIEKVFNQKTGKLKEKVSDSTSQKLKGLVGEILVGTLNPSLKRKDSSERQESSKADEDEEDSDKDD